MEILISPYADFESASKDVLSYLYRKTGLGLWMVTRTAEDDWIVLNAEDHGYGVSAGDVFRWSDSFCAQMVQGRGPRIAPQSAAVPAYANAPIGQQVPIESYIGVPLLRFDGTLFGTMCAIDPRPQPQELTQEQPIIELLAKLLTSILESDLKAQEEARRAERALQEAMIDALTGIYNRLGWVKLVAAEETRCQRYGHAAVVFSIDIDNLKEINDQFGHAAGDQHLCAAAEVMQRVKRESDVLARLGGDEFAILAVECHEQDAEVLANRLEAELKSADVQVSIGFEGCRRDASFEDALNEADQKMYANKRQRKRITS